MTSERSQPTNVGSNDQLGPFDAWWRTAYVFGFGTLWLEPIALKFARCAWAAAEAQVDANELTRLRGLYEELLFAVGNKHPGETRHQTAPRWWTCKTHGDALPHNAWGCPNCVTELRDENARLRTALDKIAERTSSDDPCRPLVQIARDALRHNVEVEAIAAGKSPRTTG